MSAAQVSHWGWGWSSKIPQGEQLSNLGALVEGMLGIEPHGPMAPVALSEALASVPRSRLAVPEQFAAFVSDDVERRARHTYGRSYRDIVRGFYGDFSVAPDLVAEPRDEDEIAAVLAWAGDHDVVVVPRGGGTSVVGGLEAERGDRAGCVVLSLRAMREVLEIDTRANLARIQAGALGPEIEDALAAQGLTLRHYPQSFEFSTLGGWLATRAGGHFATMYTHIDEFVASMRSVSPAGVWQSRRLPASGAGPSPDRLMLGSEGTLGVITEAWMRVQKRPRFRAKANLRFATWSEGLEACRRLAQSRLFPSNCRLLGPREAMLHSVASDGSTVLLLGFESAEVPQHEVMEQAVEIARQAGGRCEDGIRFRDDGLSAAGGDDRGDDDASTWRQAFFDGPYLQSALVALGIVADTFETCIGWDGIEALHSDLVRAVRQASLEACGKKALVSCRLTHVYPDGPAPYYTFVAPGEPGRELEQWAAIKAAASEVLMAHEATITHHHAVGTIHKPYYLSQSPPLMQRALRGVKRELDPRAILNPGVLIGDEPSSSQEKV